MRKILFIINPVAGQGATKKYIPIIHDLMSELDYDIKISKFEGDATQIAKGNAPSYTDIISVGGDGTLTEIIDGLDDFNGSLGILPAGTGNDFARSIELPKEAEKCLEIIKSGQTKSVDLPSLNNHHFINVASFGIDGGVIRDTDKIKKHIPGTPAYILGSLKNIIGFKPYKVTIQIDEKKLEREIVLIAVGNGKYFGGGMKVTPEAEIDDGLLDVVLANKTRRSKLIKLFSQLFNGSHMSDKIVEHYKCKEFSIESDGDIFINTDGNLIGKVPAKISVGSKKIDVIIPDNVKKEL